MRKATILSIAFLTALLALTIPLASAAYSTSFTYDCFNNETWTSRQLDKDYTLLTAKITNMLTMNTTFNGTAHLRLTNGTDITTAWWLTIGYTAGPTVDIWYSYTNASEQKIGTGTYEKGDILYVTLQDGKISVGNSTNYKEYVGEFIVSKNWNVSYVTAAGMPQPNATQGETIAYAGYVNVEITEQAFVTTGYGLDLIIALIPLIFVCAVIPMILKMLKDIGE